MDPFPYRLAAIDIDDTLVGHDKQVSPENRRAVARLSDLGCRVVLASGRRHDNMLSYCRALGLGDFLVSCQGAVARHARNGEVVHQALVPVRDGAEITAEGLERGLSVMYWSADGVFSRQRSEWTDRYAADCGDPVSMLDVESMAGRGASPAEKIIWAAEPAIIAALAPEMRRRYAGRLVLTVTDDWYLEFTSLNATKAAGVAAVAGRYGLGPAEVLAFGDGNNDVPLLEWAGLSVAMNHGRRAAHAAADLVTPEGDPETALARGVDAVLANAGFATVHEGGPLAAA